MLFFGLLIVLLVSDINTYSQKNSEARYEIMAKRGSMSYLSPDALPRGREFKRIDSTFYVGWMFEGMYKYEHAADYIGFRIAAEQLEKAIQLLVKDYKTQLTTRTTDLFEYFKVYEIHKDWDYTNYCLMQCYSNMEEPEKVWALLQRCKKMNLQDETAMDTYNYLGWTVHRNRFYTHSKYSFLKKSIRENETYANKLLDSSALKIKADAKFNATIFGENEFINQRMPAVWHYKSILYAYQLKINSAAYYYEKLRETPYFPENNYATFCAIQAKFKDAEKYYNIAKTQDPGDKRMKESFYYASVLNSYKNTNQEGIEELKNLIKSNGSTPGFGWYNLALARNLIYDGQNEIAKKYLTRAEQFKEIHIGTTLGQSHYDFTTSLLKLVIKNREIEQIKFENKNWWFHPGALTQIAKLTVEKYSQQFLIINQFSANPERDLVIYKLFSTESTVSFDEIWTLIEGFSTNFFIEKFKNEIEKDERPNVKRYFHLFLAKLYMKKEKFQLAKSELQIILKDITIDTEHEKLLLARTYEAMILCNKELNVPDINYEKLMITTYPQLVPYSEISFPMRLHSNEKNQEEKQIIESLKSSNIHWITDLSAPAADLTILFTKKGNLKIIQYSMKWGDIITPKNEIAYQNAVQISKELPYAIFGIGNDERMNLK